jgi:hypothetical protein
LTDFAALWMKRREFFSNALDKLAIHVAIAYIRVTAHVTTAHAAAMVASAVMTATVMAVVTTQALSLTSILAHISPTPTAAHVAAHITAGHIAARHITIAHVAVLREDECAEAHHERQNHSKFIFHVVLRRCKRFVKHKIPYTSLSMSQ